ncbi:hypothetical protein [Gymnodinialimonas hymeniacidonis]|uniref:hypothetical protein n=1 Tax=Gymnodinialimonas hymeniacidonis TaxID=3126508 RepID=UPI0034C5DD9B
MTTQFRPFESRDLPWTAFGLAFGLFYGAMTIAFITAFGMGTLVILLFGLPFLLLQLAVIIGFDFFLKWRRRNDPPPPPIAWLRYHAVSIGAATGAAFMLIWIFVGRVL